MSTTTITAQSTIVQPEPDLTEAEIISRAQSLRAELRENQENVEINGAYSREMHETFQKFGFYRMLQPKKYGGYEFSIRTFYKTMIEIGRGCPSTSWCLATASGHAISLATYWPEASQTEIFGPTGDFRSPHRVPPQGRAVPVEGGFIVTGQWDYCSGIPYSTHLLGNAPVFSDTGDLVRIISFFTPAGSYEILDNWGGNATLGLRGSGSNSVRLEDVFVPESHTVTGHWFAVEDRPVPPGREIHTNPLFGGRLAGYYEGEVTGAIVGAAHAAVDEFEEIITTRPALFDPSTKRYEHTDFQRIYGMARAQADAAELILLGVADRITELMQKEAQSPGAFTYEDDCWLFAQAQQAGKLASESIHMVYNGAGSAAASGTSKMSRYLRDVSMFDSHMSQQYEAIASGVARAHFGLMPGPLG